MCLKPVVFCDFDGTITQVDATDLILTELAHPSWREVEQEWVRGAIGSRECLERQMALVETSEQQLNALIDSLPLDPDFARFYGFVQSRGLPFYVVSDGFDYVIQRTLKRAGIDGQLRNGVQLFASALRFEGRRLATSFPHAGPGCAHGCATCKAAIIQRLGQEHDPIVFVGDGLSDRFAVEEADLVFARRQLLAYCGKKRIECRSFQTFRDVQRELTRKLKGESGKSKVRSRKAKVKGQRSRARVLVPIPGL